MKIISFDIGLKTCSVAVEEYKIENCELVSPQAKQQYIKGGEATEPMKQYIQNVSMLGQVLLLEKRCLGDKKTFFVNQAFHNLYAWCQELNTHLQTADIILIEQQMKTNNIALALMYHLQAYLLIHYPTKDIRLYPSKNKTRILGAPLYTTNAETNKVTRVTKYQRKKWSTECASVMLKARNDQQWFDYIFVQNKSKKDDLSDVLMQSLSYIVHHCKEQK
jgi:hypothetical protein